MLEYNSRRAAGDITSARRRGIPVWGWGIPSVLKRVAVLIPAQTGWGTRVEEPQVEHGVEGEGERMWETR